MTQSDAYTGTTAMVLGSAGFIGRWVARQLNEHGADVHLVVRDREKASRIFERFSVKGKIHEADLSRPAEVTDLYESVRPDIAFNLAGYGMRPSEVDEAVARSINADLPEAICRAAVGNPRSAWNGQQIVHAGSAAEYGPGGGGFDEDSTCSPSTVYGITKLAGTEGLNRSSENRGVKAITARIFNAYGAGERQGRLLPSLLKAARRGESLDLTGGEQKRDFTYVEDVAEGLLRLGLLSQAEHSAVNLATGNFTTVRCFAETAARVTGMDGDRLNFGSIPMDRREDDWNVDGDAVPICRLQTLTNWSPSTTVSEGIVKTWNYATERKSIITGDI